LRAVTRPVAALCLERTVAISQQHTRVARTATEAREDLTKVVQEVNDLITALPQLYDKLGASDRTEAVSIAIRRGIIQL